MVSDNAVSDQQETLDISKDPTNQYISEGSTSFLCLIERMILRTFHCVLCNIDKTQAQFMVTSIMHVYYGMRSQLPERVARHMDLNVHKLVVQSDSELVTLWISLLNDDSQQKKVRQKSSNRASNDGNMTDSPRSMRKICDYSSDKNDHTLRQTSDSTTLITRLCRNITEGISHLFSTSLFKRPLNLFHILTPVTSPEPENMFGFESCDKRLVKCEHKEPGWAILYMEQETKIPHVIAERMRLMMHTTVPLNLFHAEVLYDHSDQLGHDLVSGFVSPESFPPTPIGREHQSRKLQHYTTYVLHRTNKALLSIQAADCY